MLDCQTSSAERSKFRSYHYNARWYDAGTGRFISEDPARDGANWYTYVSNNPLKYIDPTGMTTEEELDQMTPKAIADREKRRQGSGNGNDGGSGGPKAEDAVKPTTVPINGENPPPVVPGQNEIPEDVVQLLKQMGELESYIKNFFGSNNLNDSQEIYERIQMKISYDKSTGALSLRAISESRERQIYTDRTEHYDESNTKSKTSDITLTLDIITGSKNEYQVRSLSGTALNESYAGKISGSISTKIQKSENLIGAKGTDFFETTEGTKTFEVGILW